MSNFVFYDFETSSSNKYWGQIIQIGAILTNDNLEELDRFDARCRLSPGIIPEAMALIVNKSSPEMLKSSNLSHYEMIRQFVDTLKRWGKATYVGETGWGQVAKLANQAIVGITIEAVSEALILSKAAGANPRAVREAIKNGFAGSPILENHGNRILNGNFKPGGKCSTQLKDMQNIIETARDYNVHLPISNKIKELYTIMVKQGKSNLDHSALYLLLKRFKKYWFFN